MSRKTFRLNRYPQEALQIAASVWSRPPIFTTMVEAVGHKPPRTITVLVVVVVAAAAVNVFIKSPVCPTSPDSGMQKFYKNLKAISEF